MCLSKHCLQWIQIPLMDQSSQPQVEAFQQAIQAVTEAYRADKKVAFHCGGGKAEWEPLQPDRRGRS